MDKLASDKIFVCTCGEHEFCQIIQVDFPRYLNTLQSTVRVNKDRLDFTAIGIKCMHCNMKYYFPLDAEQFTTVH